MLWGMIMKKILYEGSVFANSVTGTYPECASGKLFDFKQCHKDMTYGSVLWQELLKWTLISDAFLFLGVAVWKSVEEIGNLASILNDCGLSFCLNPYSPDPTKWWFRWNKPTSKHRIWNMACFSKLQLNLMSC